eukprot:5394407-Prymnesium_polylepis.1
MRSKSSSGQTQSVFSALVAQCAAALAAAAASADKASPDSSGAVGMEVVIGLAASILGLFLCLLSLLLLRGRRRQGILLERSRRTGTALRHCTMRLRRRDCVCGGTRSASKPARSGTAAASRTKRRLGLFPHALSGHLHRSLTLRSRDWDPPRSGPASQGGGLHGWPDRLGSRCALAVVRPASNPCWAAAGRAGQCPDRAQLLPGALRAGRAQGHCPSVDWVPRAKHVQQLFHRSRRGR